MDNVDYGFGNHLSMNFQTYLLLRPGTDPKAFEKNFKQYLAKYVIPQAKAFMNINSMEEFQKAGNKLELTLMPVTDIHLYSDRFPELGPNSSIQYVYIFSAVAIFILLIACINFMNLSTARSSNRAKEVGIRKVLGTDKKALIGQFLTESIMMSIIALILSLLIAFLIMPLFNDISGKEFTLANSLTMNRALVLLSIPVVVGVIAGSYPAFYLSSFQPIAVLKGKINAGFKRSSLRNVLVVVQFATSIILIFGTIIIYRQLNYIQNKKLGFNKDQVLLIQGTGALANNVDAFRIEVSKMSGVKSSSFAGLPPNFKFIPQ
jgi:putative ABC transport system permease protein